jgi:hypothetical protein
MTNDDDNEKKSASKAKSIKMANRKEIISGE